MELSYSDTGQGNVVVLLHGFCESRALWNDFENFLSQKYRVICPDLPGYGQSRLEVSNVSMAYFAEEIKRLLDSLSIDQCTMIGHSLGGYVTLAFAEKHPHRLKGIGLFHSTAYAYTELKKANRNKTIKFIEENGVDTFASSFVPPLFDHSTREKYGDEINYLIKVAKNTDPLAVIETSKAMRDRPDRTSVLEGIQVPVMFIIGKEDGAVPFESSMKQVGMPKESVVHIYEKCGHMGMIEKKEETMKAVNSFLEYCN